MKNLLHTHPFTEKILNLEPNHVIVDEKDVEYLKGSLFILQENLILANDLIYQDRTKTKEIIEESIELLKNCQIDNDYKDREKKLKRILE